MEEGILDELGRRYIGDPKTVGLSDSVYSDDLKFDTEELSQKTLKKRYLVSMTLGQKHDTVAMTVNNQVRNLFNVVGFTLLILSILMVVTHVADMAGSTVKAAAGVVQNSQPMTLEQRQQQMLQSFRGQ